METSITTLNLKISVTLGANFTVGQIFPTGDAAGELLNYKYMDSIDLRLKKTNYSNKLAGRGPSLPDAAPNPHLLIVILT